MSQLNSPISLSQFLRDKNTQLRLFDMGRRVSKIPSKDFENFELGNLVYPYPYQQTAWVGILFWNIKNKDQHNLWFIRMPLDEQGFINVATRDEFLDLMLSRIADNITAKNKSEDNLSHALKDNPYVFKPTVENMSVFNAKAKLILNLPPSEHYKNTIRYLTENNYDDWQSLGLQGFADIAIRHSEQEVNNLLCGTLNKLPEAPFCAICNALENEQCSQAITDVIAKIIESLLNGKVETSEAKIVSAMRAMANSNGKKAKEDIIQKILNSNFGSNTTILTMIAAKRWDSLDSKPLLKLYLENLAACSDVSKQAIFNTLVSDLIFLPRKRKNILEIFRDPNRNNELSTAIGGFFNNMGHNQ